MDKYECQGSPDFGCKVSPYKQHKVFPYIERHLFLTLCFNFKGEHYKSSLKKVVKKVDLEKRGCKCYGEFWLRDCPLSKKQFLVSAI